MCDFNLRRYKCSRNKYGHYIICECDGDIVGSYDYYAFKRKIGELGGRKVFKNLSWLPIIGYVVRSIH